MDFVGAVGEPAILEQMAEECCELGHAALKRARILRAENPTPAREEDSLSSLMEEMADVVLMIDVFMRSQKRGLMDGIEMMMELKEERWEKRLSGLE